MEESLLMETNPRDGTSTTLNIVPSAAFPPTASRSLTREVSGSGERPSYVPRTMWGAAERRTSWKPMHHPIRDVVVHNVKTHDNSTSEEFPKRLRKAEMRSMKSNSGPPANFYVSINGRVYEGRGWNYVCDYDLLNYGLAEFDVNTTLFVHFFGSLERSSTSRVEALEKVLEEGLKRGFILQSYRLWRLEPSSIFHKARVTELKSCTDIQKRRVC